MVGLWSGKRGKVGGNMGEVRESGEQSQKYP